MTKKMKICPMCHTELNKDGTCLFRSEHISEINGWDKEIEQREVFTNISLAFVNGHITAQQAAQAHDGLLEYWNEMEHER